MKNNKISSFKFILLLSLYLSFVLNMGFIRDVYVGFPVTNILSFLGFIFITFIIPIPMFLILNLIMNKYTLKPFSVMLLLISSGTNYMILNNGIYIDTTMIRNVFETNLREARDLFSLSVLIYIFVLGVIPSILVCRAKVFFYTFKKEFIQRICFVGLALLSLVLYFLIFARILMPFGRNNEGLQHKYNTVNYLVNTVRYIRDVAKQSKTFKIIDANAKPDMFDDSNNHILVLVIGETARTKNFSLYNYEKETSPLLSKEKNLIAIPDVTSCGTATAMSLPCMFSSKARSKFDVDVAKYEENLLDLLKRAGWKIIWNENDDGCKNVCNRVESYDMVKTGNPDFCFGDYCHDDILLNALEKNLKEVKPKENVAIVLHTMGSHGPTYYKRYPDKFRKFTPVCDTADIQNCTQEEIINTYDNTILYTDYIIANVINQLKKYKDYETSVIYLSDHGESLGEDGMYLHGLPYKLAPMEQKVVPFFVWLSDKMLKDAYIDLNCLKNYKFNKVSHDNFFHTVLGLSETDSVLYDKTLDVLNDCRIKKTSFMKR